jgi:chromosome segregation ATPase
MKKSILIWSTAAMSLLAAGTVVSCSSPQQKEENAQEQVAEAKEDLAEARQDAAEAHEEAVSDAEWQAFKDQTNAQIDANQALIGELRKKKRKADNEMTEDAFKAHIDELQEQNKQLRQRLNDYEKNRGDWGRFKAEYNNSMDELKQSLEDMRK